MSTAKRRRGHSLHLELPNGEAEDLPSVAAVFLILFDIKAGYTIAWKRSSPGLDLDESVEFKSLPSGLHNVEKDLIYFIHDEDYAGISAFVNNPAEESDRNALMLAVGALIPKSYGRLGKSWKHAAKLKELAKKLSQEPSQTEPLEEFWTAHQLHEEDSQEQYPQSPSVEKVKRKQGHPSPNNRARTRNRAVSTASALAPPGQSLSPHHPALSLHIFLDTFGPLIFPIYKAALLRKRTLIVGPAPVELACNFVYDISILSGIPSAVVDLLPLDPLPTRLKPLFSVGVHDMASLTPSLSTGWIACTTDDILALKPQLYDTVITLPPAYSAQAKEKVWPKLEVKRGIEVKATQRDLRRYRTLRRELQRLPSTHSPYTSRHSDKNPDDPAIENPQDSYDDTSSTLDTDLVEPQSWSALAYNSFMWWASAGEKRTDLDEEEEGDASLLHHFSDPFAGQGSPNRSRTPGGSPSGGREALPGLEMSIIAYFHRLTSLILGKLSEIVDGADSAEETILVESEDMTRMGLDVWSEGDREFVGELVSFWWGKSAEVRGGRVECCGVRIC